ncbi:Uncharacterized protein Fot_42149 [Forsythia ovata]|uniref:Uncharacterized protein n=1 Tax=Forsythia ovata TaxID=205694 RepID=A0ABD1RLV1_9LAMI
MADVLNHGGDGGDEPPHQHANRLQADCQTGTHVRQFVHPYFDRWANVPEEQKARATGCVHEFSDVNPRRYSKADYKLIVDGIEDTVARRYRQYKANVNAYIRDKGTSVPYRGLTADVWEKCIERSSSKKFKRDRQTQEWPSVIETFKVNHQRKGEKKWWRNGKSKRSKLAPAAWQLTEHDVVLKVLGERRGHRRVVGWVLRGTSRSHSSTTTLQDQHSTSQSTQATNALKSKMETYMHQMNEFITLLTSNLQYVMPGIQLPTPPPPPPCRLCMKKS